MSGFGDVRITGDKQLMATFSKLPERVARGAIRKAVNFGGTPIVSAGRKRIPKESGLSKKAMGKRVVTYKQTHSVACVIGVRKDAAGVHDGRRRVPQFYQHLIHDGHVARDGSFVPGTKYMSRAYAAALPQARARMESKLAQEIMKEASKP